VFRELLRDAPTSLPEVTECSEVFSFGPPSAEQCLTSALSCLNSCDELSIGLASALTGRGSAVQLREALRDAGWDGLVETRRNAHVNECSRCHQPHATVHVANGCEYIEVVGGCRDQDRQRQAFIHDLVRVFKMGASEYGWFVIAREIDYDP
jgi:hypothetical protein